MPAFIPSATDLADDARRDADPVMRAGVAPVGYRLPDATHLGHVTLQVTDLARSIAYYEQVLGLRTLQRTSTGVMLGTREGSTPLVHLVERRAVILNEAAALHALRGAEESAAQGTDLPVTHHPRLGLYHFAILLPDRAALGRFVARLGEIGVRAGASDHLVSEALYLRDPDGLGIEVYADRPRSSWTAVDWQLQMASEALDIADLVRSAAGVRWAGMPAGTVMGHVHLHVAALEPAAAFYHAALGLDKMVWSYPGALFLAAGGYHHHLGLNTWAGANALAPTSDDARLLEWRMVLPSARDVQAAAASLAAAGHTVMADGSDCIATDPWGTRVRLLA
ncbi:MAG: VOC family protein [bacterium]